MATTKRRTTKSVFEEVGDELAKLDQSLQSTPEAALVLHLAGMLEAAAPKEVAGIAKALREARVDLAVLVDKVKPIGDQLDEIKNQRERRRSRAHG